MKLFKRLIFILFISFNAISAFAQINSAETNVNENSFMTSDGKIMVVMAVVLVIIVGLFIYLFNLDKRLSKLEKKK